MSEPLSDWEFYKTSRNLGLEWAPIVPEFVRQIEHWQKNFAALTGEVTALAEWDGQRAPAQPDVHFACVEWLRRRLWALHQEKANLQAEIDRLRAEKETS